MSFLEIIALLFIIGCFIEEATKNRGGGCNRPEEHHYYNPYEGWGDDDKKEDTLE